ncbi:phage tail length tape measure family protein [Ectopseudomonas hydrolytica]|jgi:phage-related minor tail protein|uniref:Phage tail length tape measure family protein n=1 Tax=Ectopseudomonas hydrolytica TaxID=2493633 RepID=A0ABY5A3D7_9GAMM|nr:phage tail length tape measure family protein [Pseudomonas hydrolytica]USR38087.1 phage tail length tape measure family protein [Pseudomonas hydrolytica]
MNNRGDIEFALRLRTDLEQGQQQLQALADSVENVGAAAATSSTQLGQVGESADQQAARIRAMVEASLQQQAAADGMAESIQRSAAATQEANSAWQQNAAAQTEAMNAYHGAERAAQEKAQADLRAAEAAAQAAASAEKEGQELQQLLGKIDPVIRKLDELDSMEQQLRRARASGQIDLDTFDEFNTKLQEQRQRLGGTTDAMRVAGITAGQYQQAMRQLPMQITDITTSLASGMPVWLVAVQQGGQIRDSFGSWANAGRALVSTINPLTLAIASVTAAIGATVIAAVQGAAETYEYEKAIALTGNSAGVTSDRLAGMAREISGISGTQRQAAAALAEITASGKFTADQIKLIGTTAVLMQNNVGQAISATVEDFKKLAEEPAEASAKLNVEYNYLTLAVYEQIAALEAQGDQAGATQLAMEALGGAMQSRSVEIAEKLGLIESAWKGITNVAAVAWDAMLGIGREETLDDQLAAIQRQRQAAQFGVRGDRVGGAIDPVLEARLAAEEEGIRRRMELDAQNAKQTADEKAANREAIEASKERTKAGDAFLKSAEAQLQSLQNLTSVERAQRVMQEQNIEATSELGRRMLEAAAATDKQREANEAEAEAKRRATEEQRKATAAQREQERAAQAALRATEQSIRQQLSYVQGLEDQASKIGLTAAEVRQYELAEKGLTGAMLDRAQAALALIDASEAQRQADANARANAGLEAEFLRASGRETDAALLEIRTKFAGMRTEFEKAGNEAGLAWLDKLIPVAEAKVRVDDVQREMDRILNDAQRQEQSVNVQQDAGLITELQARERILEIHRETAGQLEKMRPILSELAQQPGEIGEAAKGMLSQINDYILRAEEGANKLRQALEDGLTNGLTQALQGLARGTMTLREAVSALGQSVLDALTRMAAENLAQSITGGVMGLFGGAGGGDTDLTSGAAAVTSSAVALSGAGSTLIAGAAALEAAAISLAAANGVAGAAGSKGGAGGGSGWLGTLLSLGGMFAGGGAGAAAGSGGFMSSVMASRFADGGHVRGPGTTTSDSIPAWLSDYEYVVRASVVTQPGMLDHLNALNTHGLAALDAYRIGHSTGGLAGIPAPALPSPGLGTTRMAEPRTVASPVTNKISLYTVDNAEEMAARVWSAGGSENYLLEKIGRNPMAIRQLLGFNH